jgi:hypothetical protein
MLANPTGIYALLILIPFIILYLIRPRPKHKIMPSLMFFIKEKGLKRRQNFLRNLLRNLLFFLQLLALAALAFSIASPFVTISEKAAAQNTILILDVSASSQTTVDGISRFEKTMNRANEFLEGRISIVLAQNMPLLVLDKASKGKALDILQGLGPRDTSSDIGDAMLLAPDILEGRPGRVVVISDFINTLGPDPLVAKRILTAQGIEVIFVDVGTEAENVGITNLLVSKYLSKVYVKNFGSSQKEINLDVLNYGQVLHQKTLSIAPGSIETFNFETPDGITEVSIREQDALAVDNKAYIAVPTRKKINTLLITNSGESHLKKALLASKDIQLSVAQPPVIPSLDYDVIIMHKFDKSLILPSFYKDVVRVVEKGSALVITAQSNLKDENFGNLLMVELEKLEGSSTITTLVINEFTKDIDFGFVSKYFKATPKEEALVLAQTDDESPIIALTNKGYGTIIYYGIFDDYSGFKMTTGYPIFWNQLLNFLVQTANLEDYNFNTDRVLTIKEQEVKTPTGRVTTSKLLLDKTGVYEFGGKRIVANLMNELESDVSRKSALEEEEKLLVQKVEHLRDINFELALVVLGLLLMLAELGFIKWRGDI